MQKGQFIQGSVVTIQELNERLQPTGKSYQTQILDDMGSFELTSDIDSRYVEIIAEGFYFNEVTGNLSDAPLTLRSLSDLQWKESRTSICSLRWKRPASSTLF